MRKVFAKGLDNDRSLEIEIAEAGSMVELLRLQKKPQPKPGKCEEPLRQIGEAMAKDFGVE